VVEHLPAAVAYENAAMVVLVGVASAGCPQHDDAYFRGERMQPAAEF
jgi:hypothetical protein